MMTLKEILSGLTEEELQGMANSYNYLTAKKNERRFLLNLLQVELVKQFRKMYFGLGPKLRALVDIAYENYGCLTGENTKTYHKITDFDLQTLKKKGILFPTQDNRWALPLEYYFLDVLPKRPLTSIIQVLRNINNTSIKKIAVKLGINTSLPKDSYRAEIFHQIYNNRESIIDKLTREERRIISFFLSRNGKLDYEEYEKRYGEDLYYGRDIYDAGYNKFHNLFLNMILVPVQEYGGWIAPHVSISDEYIEIFRRDEMKSLEIKLADMKKNIFMIDAPYKVSSLEDRFIIGLKYLFLAVIAIKPRRSRSTYSVYKKDMDRIKDLTGVEESFLHFLFSAAAETGLISDNEERYVVTSYGLKFIENEKNASMWNIFLKVGDTFSIDARSKWTEELVKISKQDYKKFVDAKRLFLYMEEYNKYLCLKQAQGHDSRFTMGKNDFESYILHLCDMGILQLGTNNDNKIAGIRFTNRGCGILNVGPVPDSDLSSVEDKFIIQPNQEILAELRISFPILVRLAQICELKKIDKMVHFNLNVLSLRQALEEGWTIEEIERFLKNHSKQEMPQTIVYLLQDVSRREKEIEIMPALFYFKVKNPLIAEVIKNIPQLNGHIDAVAENILIARQGAGMKEVETILKKKGYFVQVQDKSSTISSSIEAGDSEEFSQKEDNFIAEIETNEEGIVKLMDIAIDTDSKVEIDYKKDGKITKRTIEPLGWTNDKVLWAYCHLQNNERIFKLSKIISAVLLGDGAERRVAV